MLLIDIVKALEKNNVPYVLVGGYALALQGIVRATVDIDFVISLKESHLVQAEKILKDLGLQSRIPVSAKEIAEFHNEYREKRNLIAWSFVNFKNPGLQVDLLIYPPIKILKSETVSVHGVKIRVATKKTLLEMKQLSNRDEDQLDIKKLLEALANEKK